jgi:hypothetical protein
MRSSRQSRATIDERYAFGDTLQASKHAPVWSPGSGSLGGERLPSRKLGQRPLTSWRRERAREEAFEEQVRAWYLAHPEQRVWEEREWARAHPDAGLLDAGLP